MLNQSFYYSIFYSFFNLSEWAFILPTCFLPVIFEPPPLTWNISSFSFPLLALKLNWDRVTVKLILTGFFFVLLSNWKQMLSLYSSWNLMNRYYSFFYILLLSLSFIIGLTSSVLSTAWFWWSWGTAWTKLLVNPIEDQSKLYPFACLFTVLWLQNPLFIKAFSWYEIGSTLVNKCVPHSQANLVINPAALLPDAFSRIPGGVSVLPGLSPSPSSSGPSASLSPAGTKPHSNKGVSFENPVQVSTLQSANKVGQGSGTGVGWT